MGTYVRMVVGNETYAFPVEHVKEVAHLGALTPVPGGPTSLLGVYNLKGEIIPVYELSAVLGLDRTASQSRLLVAELGSRLIGLAVSDIEDVLDLQEPNEPTDSPLLHSAAIVGSDLVGFIDVEALFATLETKENA